MPSPCRITVTHVAPLVARGVAEVLARQPDMEVVGEGLGAGPAEAVDVLVADYERALQALEAGRGLRRQAPRVLILTMNRREHDVRLAVERGAHGYLMLDCTVDALTEAVRAVARGQKALCPEAAERIADSMTLDDLTPRESEVLHLLVHGRSNKAIARELGLAVGTVKTHIRAILAKVGARSRTEAISVCHRRGLTAGSENPAAFHAPPRHGAVA